MLDEKEIPKDTIVKKGKKYLTGYSYVLGKRSFSWTFDKNKATKYNGGDADTFAKWTGGKIVNII
jgi:hypothetical protein